VDDFEHNATSSAQNDRTWVGKQGGRGQAGGDRDSIAKWLTHRRRIQVQWEYFLGGARPNFQKPRDALEKKVDARWTSRLTPCEPQKGAAQQIGRENRPNGRTDLLSTRIRRNEKAHRYAARREVKPPIGGQTLPNTGGQGVWISKGGCFKPDPLGLEKKVIRWGKPCGLKQTLSKKQTGALARREGRGAGRSWIISCGNWIQRREISYPVLRPRSQRRKA